MREERKTAKEKLYRMSIEVTTELKMRRERYKNKRYKEETKQATMDGRRREIEE